MNLTKKYNSDVLLIGIICYFIIYIYNFETSILWTSLLSLLCFITSIAVMNHSMDRDCDYYTQKRLFCNVAIYSLIFVSLFHWVSIEYQGDTFIFSNADARTYEKDTMIMSSMSWDTASEYMSRKWKFDDWGAFVFMQTAYRIIDSKLFLNFIYILLGCAGSVILFKIGQRFLSIQYAYICSLIYSISSFNIFFMGSFLKESIFVFFVLLLFNSIYNLIDDDNKKSIFYIIVYSICICLFRPAVLIMILGGMSIYYIQKSASTNQKIAVLLLLGIILLYFYFDIVDIYNHYTHYGDIDYVLNSKKESSIMSRKDTYIINFFAAAFGPFPTLVDTGKHLMCLYGAGLLYRCYLNVPFIMTAKYIIFQRIEKLYPILFFVIAETISVALVQKGFELRLSIPHLSFTYLLAFIYLDNNSILKQSGIETCRVADHLKISLIVITLIVLLWGILR